MSVEIENVRKDIRMRAESDTMMSSAWLLFYLAPILTAILAISVVIISVIVTISMFPTTYPPTLPTYTQTILVSLTVLLYLIAIIGFIVQIILIYKLVKRRNTHFKRQNFLFEDVIAAVKAIAAKKGVDVELALSSSERTVREAKAEETEKSAALWAILSAIIFLALWYVWYFLMKDFYKHERREDGFWEDTSKVMDKCGIKFSAPRRMVTLPDRSFVLYLILSIITLGLFGIYWLYVLLQDPNQHFKYHMQTEDQLLTALETAVATT